MGESLTTITALHSTDGGHTVRFRLTAGGREVEYQCTDDDLQKIALALNMIGRDANTKRKSLPQAGQIVDPIEVIGISLGRLSDGEVAMQFGTKAGFPLTVALPIQLAADLPARLLAALDAPVPKKNPN